ncbi:hypothetical protein Tco_0493093 [Tanacetum coccineum]
MTRIRVLPWHVFLGLYTYGLAVVMAETGLLEKFTFLQTKIVVLKRCSESMIVNGLGMRLAILCGLVILTAVSPKQYQSWFSDKKPDIRHTPRKNSWAKSASLKPYKAGSKSSGISRCSKPNRSSFAFM